jgi:hypothetical protein
VGDRPIYAVCSNCAWLRVFGSTVKSSELPDDCPACGHEVRIHSRRERFPSVYVSRTSMKLHHTPPLSV